jgi:hypothetical protein
MTTVPTPLEGRPWSARRFYYATLVAFILQVSLVWFLADRPKPAQPPEVFQTRVQLATVTWPTQDWQNQLHPADSVFIPLPNQHGFSGDAWLRFRPLAYVPENWHDSEVWLAPDTRNLGTAFQKLAAREGGTPTHVGGRPILPLAGDELVAPNLLLPTRSELDIEGDLAGRKLQLWSALPSWPHHDILTNTVIQVAVQADGLVFSAALLLPCGLPEADAFALSQARAAHFVPEPSSAAPSEPGVAPLTFGLLVFRWHSDPLPPQPVNTVRRDS